MKNSQRMNTLLSEATQMALEYNHAQVTLYDVARALAYTPVVKMAFADND